MKGKSRLIIQVLVIVALVCSSAMLGWKSVDASSMTITNCTQWHTVKSGDYLYSIAKQYSVDWRDIAKLNNLVSPYLIHPGQQLCVSVSGTTNPPKPTPPPANPTVRVYATQVWEDKQVNLQGKGLVANSAYSVYLSNFKGYNPPILKVGSITTDKNGTFSKSFNLPGKLIDVAKIRVRLDNGKKDIAENWFINANVSGNTGGFHAPPLTLGFLSVKQGKSVRVSVSNIPANVFFKVYVGKPGTSLNQMFQVDWLKSPQGKNVSVDFAIPAQFSSTTSLELRLVNTQIEMFAQMPFTNK